MAAFREEEGLRGPDSAGSAWTVTIAYRKSTSHAFLLIQGHGVIEISYKDSSNKWRKRPYGNKNGRLAVMGEFVTGEDARLIQQCSASARGKVKLTNLHSEKISRIINSKNYVRKTWDITEYLATKLITYMRKDQGGGPMRYFYAGSTSLDCSVESYNCLKYCITTLKRIHKFKDLDYEGVVQDIDRFFGGIKASARFFSNVPSSQLKEPGISRMFSC